MSRPVRDTCTREHRTGPQSDDLSSKGSPGDVLLPLSHPRLICCYSCSSPRARLERHTQPCRKPWCRILSYGASQAPPVRAQAEVAARQFVRSMSPHATPLLLPALFDAMDAKRQWQIKASRAAVKQRGCRCRTICLHLHAVEVSSIVWAWECHTFSTPFEHLPSRLNVSDD